VDVEPLRREPREIERLAAERHEHPRAEWKVRARVPFERGAARAAMERRRPLGPALFPESLVQRTSAPLLFPEPLPCPEGRRDAVRYLHASASELALSYSSAFLQ